MSPVLQVLVNHQSDPATSGAIVTLDLRVVSPRASPTNN
jgi:hypothetical protein